MKYEPCVQMARTLHYAVRLPVRLYQGSDRLYSLPEDQPPVWEGLTCGGGPASWPVTPGSSTVQYVIGRTGERYICQFAGDDYAFILGPLCLEPFSDKELNWQLKIYYASVKEREAVRAAILSLQRLSEDSFFYTGRLLQLLCGGQPPPQDAAEAVPETDVALSADALYRHPPYFMEREITQYIAEQDETNALNTLARSTACTAPTCPTNRCGR